MPPVKPGRWSANPSSIDPHYQSLWRGLVALVPIWGDPTPIELVKRKLATDTTRPKMTPIVGRYGPALRQSQALDSGASWLAGDYNEFSTNPATTLAWVGTRVGVGDATGPHIWGYYVSETVQIRLVSFDDEILYLEYNNDFIGSVVMPTNTPILGLAFVTNGRQYLRLYNLSTTARIGSDSATTAFSPPAAGGRLVLGSAAAFSIGVDHLLGAAWNRELTDAEIGSLLIDPFGLIRPRVESQGAVASLYATATHTVTEVEAHVGLPDIGDDPILHLDATQLALAEGAGVTQWDDLSASGLTLVDGAFAPPTYIADSLNGLPGVAFMGNTDALEDTSGVSFAAPQTMFFVVHTPPDDATWRYIHPQGAGLLLVKSPANAWSFGHNGSGGTFISWTDGAITNEDHLFTYVQQETGAFARVDGSQVVAGNLAGPIPSITTVRFGNVGGSAGTTGTSFILYEFIMYPGVLSLADIQTIEAYLTQKWFSPLHQSVDDDPSSPSDTDWAHNTVDVALGASVFLGLTDLPSDFGNAEGGSIMVRVRGSQVSGSLHLHARLYQSDETTPLSNEVEAVAISSDGVFTNYSASFTGLNTSASKTVWDASRVRLRWSDT